MFNLFGKNDKKEKKEKEKSRKTTQDTMPYKKVWEDGIILNNDNFYTREIEFTDINYQISTDEDQESIFLDYCKMINTFDKDLKASININNKNIDRKKFEEKIFIKEKNDYLDNLRKEYNSILLSASEEGKNEIIKKCSIVISIKADGYEEARAKFIRLENDIIKQFKRMGSETKILTLAERLEKLHDFFRIGREGEFKYEPKEHKKKGILTKDLVCPDSFEFKRDYFMIGDKYARALFLRDLPHYLNDRFISDLTSFDKPLMLNIDINAVNPQEALKIVKKQITGMESNKIEYQKRSAKSGYLEAFIPHELKSSLDDAEELLEDLTKNNQKMFFVDVVLVHIANSKSELDRDSKTLEAIANGFVCQLGRLNLQQEDGLRKVLPLGLEGLNIKRTLTTESTAVLLPFQAQEMIEDGGMYYGKNAVSRKLLIFDRKKLKNPNGFILGTPGSGKSFSAKREMANVILNTDDDVIIIDPEREYAPLVHKLGGEIIHISAGSKNHINPMDLTEDYSDEDDPLILKSEFMLSLCECLIGGRNGLTSKEKTIIDRCLKKTYYNYIENDFDEDYIPTLKDFHKVLKEQQEDEAREIALALELYIEGSLSTFANKTNVNIDNRIVLYDIKDLGKQLKTMGMLIVLDAVWNRITKNRAKGKNTWIYMDEIYILFQNEYSAQFLFELFKRARKWGGIPTGITQNVEDLLQSELARKMLSNSDFILMLNQAALDRMQLAKLLNISDTQISYVTNSNEGEGLLFSGKSIIPFVDKFPRNTELYSVMTTKVSEVKELLDSKNEN